MIEEIVVKLGCDGLLDVVAIVRKVVRDDEGRWVRKYGLSDTGEWVLVAEAERYPEDCLLPVLLHDDSGELTC